MDAGRYSGYGGAGGYPGGYGNVNSAQYDQHQLWAASQQQEQQRLAQMQKEQQKLQAQAQQQAAQVVRGGACGRGSLMVVCHNMRTELRSPVPLLNPSLSLLS